MTRKTPDTNDQQKNKKKQKNNMQKNTKSDPPTTETYGNAFHWGKKYSESRYSVSAVPLAI
jgi:hypothetical protein